MTKISLVFVFLMLIILVHHTGISVCSEDESFDIHIVFCIFVLIHNLINIM